MDLFSPTNTTTAKVPTSEQITASAVLWEKWVVRLFNLRRAKHSIVERLQKPVLLLSVLDLLDRGEITTNRVPLSDELMATFAMYLSVAQGALPKIQLPYCQLTADEVWRFQPNPGRAPIDSKGVAALLHSVPQIREAIEFAEFDPDLWQLLKDPSSRSKIREVLIARYFPVKRSMLNSLSPLPDTLRLQTLAWNDSQLRAQQDAAFRNLVLEIYDNRCCACGIRVVLEESSVTVAMRLIPFEISYSDHPTNGIALCPNHHWAMERHLIAPTPDKTKLAGVWRVSARLDAQDAGHKTLIELHGRALIPPREKNFTPAPEALEWRRSNPS